MSADLDAMPLRQPNSVAHMIEVRGMEAAGDVGYRDQRHQRRIIAKAIDAEPLAHVAIDDRHVTLLLLLLALVSTGRGHHSISRIDDDIAEREERFLR